MNKIAQKSTIIALSTLLSLSLVSPVLAKNPKAEFLAERSEKAGSRPGLLRDFLTKGRAAIGSCVLATKSPTSLTCTRDGKTYTILIDDKTQLRRRFWGKATLSEFQIGDTLNVIGQWTDDSHTTIKARLIRDISIQKKRGVFFGEVTSLTGSGWVMSTKRGTETVTVDSSTKFVNREGDTITKGDIKVGHRVRVKGLWDSKLNTITEVTQVKDFSLPPKPTPTPTPTP